MKQKYLFFIFFGVLFFLILLALLLTQKMGNRSQNNIRELKPQSKHSENQIQNQASSPFVNRYDQQQNSYPSLTPTNPSFPTTASQLGNIPPSPTPTKTPLSVFTSALNNIYGGPVSQTVTIFPQRPKTTPVPTPDPMKSFINALDALFSGFSNSKVDLPSTIDDGSGQKLPEQLTKETTTQQGAPSEKVYYSQCNGGYDSYPLPGGCNMCRAGCGPTSVAMILSSYIDKKFTPPAVVDLYAQNGFEAGCDGTTVGDAQMILEQNGMKTTDLLYYGETPTEEVLNDLKSYLQYGWTMFMLAKFCPKGCGHFFWIVDVDSNNNVWTYDPSYGNLYGTKIVPLNETSLNPPAQYYVAFGVKKQ